MSVCLLNILLRVEESAEVDIACTFNVHDLHIFCVEDTDSDLEELGWFVTDIPLFDGSRVKAGGIDLNPTFERALLLRAGLMVNLSVLDRFLGQALPIEAEVPILEVNNRGSNQVIPKNGIIVPNIDLQR